MILTPDSITTSADTFVNVFEFRRKMAQAREKITIDLDDIEQLFGLVEMSQRLAPSSEETRYSTVYLIAKTLQLAVDRQPRRSRISFDANQEVTDSATNLELRFGRHEGFSPPRFFADIYDLFASLVAGMIDSQVYRRHRADAVITFNYDLVLDDALKRVGVTPAYHVGSHVDCPGAVPLLKLHGSTNWGVCVNCKAKENVLVLDQKVTASPAEFRSLRCPCGSEGKFQPLSEPPPAWPPPAARPESK